MNEDGFNWLDDSNSADDQQRGAYRRVLVLSAAHSDVDSSTVNIGRRGDPFTVLAGLRLLAEDKTYIRGFLSALQLPDDRACCLLAEYRRRWEQAQQRTTNANTRTNTGRRAANVWLQQGARGFIQWAEESSE